MVNVVIKNTERKKMDFNVLVTIILGMAAVDVIISFIGARTCNVNRGGIRPLTGAGPKPRIKSPNIKANRKVRK